MRRRDGVKFWEIARDSNVTIPTVRKRLEEFGYAMNGQKDGGGCDQTTNPLTSTITVDALNGDSLPTTSTNGGA